MKLSELGQGKRKGKEYNYHGLRLIFAPPIRANFLEFSGGIASPLAELKSKYDKYEEFLKTQKDKPKEEYSSEFFSQMSSLSKQAKTTSEMVIECLQSIIPQTIIEWTGLTLEKYEEHFQTEYPDISNKQCLVDFDPPEAAYEAIYEKAKRDEEFKSWLTNTIIAVSNRQDEELELQKKT